MRFLVPQPELLALLPSAATAAHCRRVAALAMEVGGAVGPALRSLVLLEQAALLHHTSPVVLNPPATGRLLHDVFPGGAPRASAQRHEPLPEKLAAVLADFRAFPAGGTDPAVRTMAHILVVSNLVDEQIELLPYEPKPIEEVWRELDGLASLLEPRVMEAAGKTIRGRRPSINTRELPAQIAVVKELLDLLRDPRSADGAALTSLAAEDPVIAASFLQVANSSLYEKRCDIRSIRQAITYIGPEASRQLLLILGLRPLFASSRLKDLWRHSVATAQSLEGFARRTGFADPETALLAGLVHDIGRIALQRLPQATSVAMARLTERGCPPCYAEQLLLAMDHGELGAGILLLLGFPGDLVEGVRFHHRPAESESVMAAALYAAEFWAGADENLPSFRHLTASLERLGCTLQDFSQTPSAESPMSVLLRTA
jgi:putative nucleotidyltransferase with HDIG domain